MVWSDRGSAAATESSTSAIAAPSLSADIISEHSVVLRHSITIVLQGADVGQDGNDLTFRERAAERWHGADFTLFDALNDEFVAALGVGQLRPLPFSATAVLVAKAARGREHGGAIDVAGRCLGRPSLSFAGRIRTLLRRAAGDREHERQGYKSRAIAQDRYPHRKCRRQSTMRLCRRFSYCLSAKTNRAPVFFAMLLKGSPHSAANSSDTRLPQPAGTAMYCLPPSM